MTATHSLARRLPAITAATLLAAACVATGPSGGSGSSAPPAVSVGNAISGYSLTGEALSGDLYCTYYAPDGSVGTSFEGMPAEWGRWTAEGNRVCETRNGITSCNRFDIRPAGQVVMTSLDGSGGFQTSGTLTPGNRCGV